MARRTTDPTVADGTLTLKPTEQRVLAEEIPGFIANLRDPGLRERYGALNEAVTAGNVPPALVRPLGAMLELLLQGPHIGAEHGPEGVRALTALYGRTPEGAERREAAQEVNTALAALRGQTLESLAFASVPGGHSLEIETSGCRITLSIDRAGVRVEHLDVAG